MCHGLCWVLGMEGWARTGDVLVGVLLGDFLGLRGRSGLLYNHRGEQTKPGLWKTIFSSLPHLCRDAEAPVCPSPPPPYHLPAVVPAPIRLGMNGEDETSFLRQLLPWARMLTSQRGTQGARGRVTAESGPEGTASPAGLAASRRPFQRA